MVRQEGRRKVYTLTGKGEEVLRRQIERLEMMARSGKQVLHEISDSPRT